MVLHTISIFNVLKFLNIEKFVAYLVSFPLTRSLDTKACRHWKAHSGDFLRSWRVSSGLSLKKVGTGPGDQGDVFINPCLGEALIKLDCFILIQGKRSIYLSLPEATVSSKAS